MLRWTLLLSLKADYTPGLLLIIWSCHLVLINDVHMTLCDGVGLGFCVVWSISNPIKCKAVSVVLGPLPYPAATVKWPPRGPSHTAFVWFPALCFLDLHGREYFSGNWIQQDFKICMAEGRLASRTSLLHTTPITKDFITVWQPEWGVTGVFFVPATLPLLSSAVSSIPIPKDVP